MILVTNPMSRLVPYSKIFEQGVLSATNLSIESPVVLFSERLKKRFLDYRDRTIEFDSIEEKPKAFQFVRRSPVEAQLCHGSFFPFQRELCVPKICRNSV